MTLLSPHATSVEAYAELRRNIFAKQTSFIDNRITFEAANVHSGKGAARFSSVAPTAEMVTAKSMLEHNNLWFIKGDDLWFSAWYYLETGVPFTIVDFQERGRHMSPGPRICIWDKQYIGVELKARSKPKLRQDKVQVPLKKWFELKVHLTLDDQSGHVRIWQDGQKIIDHKMPTLHSADSILNALEIGITATAESTSVLVDDITISHELL
ncbi:MAG: polysaccharide lyase [Lentisphaeraceae bacterium]|nr:polysaccharide lyase [Lentisphaeraceae bacterium]